MIESSGSLEMDQDVEMPASVLHSNTFKYFSHPKFTGQGGRIGRGVDLYDQSGWIHFPRQGKGGSPERYLEEFVD